MLRHHTETPLRIFSASGLSGPDVMETTMRKLLTFLIALASIVVALIAPASAQFKGGGGFGTPGFTVPAPAAGGGPPAYTFQNTASTTAAGAALSASIDIGAAQANRLIVVGCTTGSGALTTSVVVNGVTLTADNNSTGGVSIFSGIVASGSGAQTVAVTWASGNFDSRGFTVWRVTGLSSNLVKNIASGAGQTATVNVTAGDLMFGVAAFATGGPAPFSSSTETPFATHTAATQGSSADWTIVGTNASFTINSTIAGGSGNAVATYR
jgi:hypothetical protein